LKIHAARLCGKSAAPRLLPGQFAGVTSEGFLIATGDGFIEILKVQPESKNVMSALDFAKGYIVGKGDTLTFGRPTHV
jgi:methionyl-tRNA formyltransferase